MEILVNREVRELVAMGINGIGWTQDLLGNNDALHYDEETEQYTMTQEEFEWWAEYIENNNADNRKRDELIEDYGFEEVENIINEEFEGVNDLENHHATYVRAFQRIVTEL